MKHNVKLIAVKGMILKDFMPFHYRRNASSANRYILKQPFGQVRISLTLPSADIGYFRPLCLFCRMHIRWWITFSLLLNVLLTFPSNYYRPILMSVPLWELKKPNQKKPPQIWNCLERNALWEKLNFCHYNVGSMILLNIVPFSPCIIPHV